MPAHGAQAPASRAARLADTQDGYLPYVTAVDNQPLSPVSHLTAADIESIGHELDTIRQSVIDSRGARDAAYIRSSTVVTRGSCKVVGIFSRICLEGMDTLTDRKLRG